MGAITITDSWKVGELAKLTGVTVRTLHHYDEIGLLPPSRHTHSGHRLYTETDVAKLQQIMSLKQLGFSLDDIRELVGNPNFSPIKTVEMQIGKINHQVQTLNDLQNRLKDLHRLLLRHEDIKAEQFINIIESMSVYHRYFTSEQLDTLQDQREKLSFVERQRLETESVELITKFREEMSKGTSFQEPVVVDLAQRWDTFRSKFTGGSPEVYEGVEKYYQDNPEMAKHYGMDAELYQYIKKALEHLELSSNKERNESGQ